MIQLTLSTAGETALKMRESVGGIPSYVAYDDKRPLHVLQVGDKVLGTLTAGWGHTGDDVQIGAVYSDARCEAWFEHERAWCEAAIRDNVLVPLTQGQYDALFSFVYNLGEPQFRHSTLLKLLNVGEYDAVPAQMKRWNNNGLLDSRREQEAEQWIAGAADV